jgi:4-amino-4-deoxy-L-arabinose transferase-like glycosyltransferase
MSRSVLMLAAVVAVALGIRLTYTITAARSTRITWVEGEVAHNILATGRWFERNERADLIIGRLQQRRGALIDPASLDYASIDRNAVWRPAITHPVGVGALIAAIWAVTGDQRYIQIQLLQAVMDAFVTLLVYWIAMQLFKRRRVALPGALLYAVYPPIAWQTVNLYDDVWAIDFTVAITALYLLMMRSDHRWRWLVICGLVSGVGAYFRPQVMLIVPALALATIASSGWREGLRRASAATAVAVVVITPWTVRNYADFHMLIPMRSGLWETMIGGLNELPNDFAETIEREGHRARPDLGTETPQWDAYLKPYFIRAVEQHPLFFVEALAHRVALATVLGHDTIWMHRGTQGVFDAKAGALSFFADHPLVVLEYALEPMVFLLAMVGLALTWRRWSEQNAILLAVLLSVLLPYVLMHVESRYLLPGAFIYFIWIGLGIDALAERVERASRKRSAVALHQLAATSPAGRAS